MPNQRYEQVSNELPQYPPDYNDLTISNHDLEARISDVTPIASPFRDDESVDSLARELQEFEIEEPDTGMRESLMTRAGFATKRFANSFNVRIIHPVSKILDPVYEALRSIGMQWDGYLSKLGNPLIIKRLLYVLFVTIVIFFITRSSLNHTVGQMDGGFFDSSVLNEYIPELLDVKIMKENLEYLSSMPHIAGTKGDLALARYVESYFKNNGISSLEFHEVESFLNYASNDTTNSYVKFADDSFQAKLYEMDRKALEYLAFNPDSYDGGSEVKGHLIYGNYGTKEDLENLRSSNIILKNSILLLKYGRLPPSLKINLAQEFGCLAVIFISNNDESYRSDSIQREHVGDTRYSPGDILTPGWASINDYTQRLTWDQTKSTVKLASIPLSWNDASKFMESITNNGIKLNEDDLKLESVKEYWSGNYTTDESKLIKLNNSQTIRDKHPIWNVIGRIDGREQFEKGIYIGAARDSACFGSINPNTGTAVMLELVKIFTSLQRKFNWQPLRTIYFLSFDGTDYNLAGSTEWVETRIQQLKKQGYAYIDLSDAVAGTELSIKSHPALQEVIRQVLKEVNNPNEGKSFESTWNKKTVRNLQDTKNYVPFISIVGVPSVEIKFTGLKYAKNTCYDNFENFEKNGDADMVYHKALVEILAKLIVRLVEDPLIPYNLMDMAAAVRHYAEDLKSYADFIEPNGGSSNLNYDRLNNAMSSFFAVSKQYADWKQAWQDYIQEESGMEPSLLSMNRWNWNSNLVEFEKKLLISSGLPERPVYRNVLFGAQYWSPSDGNEDFEWNTFPGVRDAIYEKNWNVAQQQMDHISNLLATASEQFVQ